MTTDSRGLDYTAPDYVKTITKIWPPDESADEFFKGSKDQKAANRWYSSVEDQPLAYADPFPFLRLREDLRRNVLEYVLGASWRGVQDVGKHTWHPDNKDGFEAPKRVTFSAVASLRTLTFHASSIKAVCRAVAIDVRVLEKTVAKPSAWLQGLWHVTTTASRALALENCRMRAVVAGRANLVADMFDRVDPLDETNMRNIRHWKAHDESEPPVTRLRDVKDAKGRPMLQVSDHIDLTLNARWESTWPDYRYYWTHDHMLSAAVMDISLVNANTFPQDGGWYEFFDPVTVRCRSGVVAYGGENVTFKIKTYSEWDEPKTLDTAVLFVPILEGVFHAQISCSFVGLS